MGTYTLTLDDEGRHAQLMGIYTYDHRWLRTRRVFGGKPLDFWHASDGTLQMELDCPPSGSCDFCTAAPTGPGEPTCAVTRPSQEYVWLDGAPIALIEADVNWNGTLNDTNAAVKFIHPGLLGEPRRVTDSARNVVWARDIPAFGHIENLRDSEDTNDIGDAQQTVGGVTTTLNLGLPGQYQEPEGVYYNWHRFYDPQVGRYWEADPLVGVGVPTDAYAYVRSRPTTFVDPLGLIIRTHDARVQRVVDRLMANPTFGPTIVSMHLDPTHVIDIQEVSANEVLVDSDGNELGGGNTSTSTNRWKGPLRDCQPNRWDLTKIRFNERVALETFRDAGLDTDASQTLDRLLAHELGHAWRQKRFDYFDTGEDVSMFWENEADPAGGWRSLR